jgi:hypothetical protein
VLSEKKSLVHVTVAPTTTLGLPDGGGCEVNVDELPPHPFSIPNPIVTTMPTASPARNIRFRPKKFADATILFTAALLWQLFPSCNIRALSD